MLYTARWSRQRTRRLARLVALLLALLSLIATAPRFVSAAPAAPALDPSFGGDGLVDTGFQVFHLLQQPDGKLIAAGESSKYEFVLARYNLDGSPDLSFGIGGRLPNTYYAGYGLLPALQPDGKLVVASYDSSTDLTHLTRYDGNGRVDTSFGVNGTIKTGPNFGVSSIVPSSDGKLLLGGTTVVNNEQGWPLGRLMMQRYTADGKLDSSFGGNGTVVHLEAIGSFRDVILQPDGKIAAAAGATGYDFLLARYNADGSPDTTFDEDGIMISNLGWRYRQTGSSLALQPDGKYVVSGISGTAFPCLVVARFQSSGEVDTSFTGDGYDCSFEGSEVAPIIQPDGKIIAGNLVRYKPDGTLDPTFARLGIISYPPQVNTLLLQADGRLVLGHANMMRYLTEGYGEVCFPETARCSGGRLREYWEQNGGLPVFGFPTRAPSVSMQQEGNDLKRFFSQWFERNRLEIHPENSAPYDVLLGRLGDELLQRQGRYWQDLPRAAGPQDGCLWFADTRHNVCNQAGSLGFLSYWQSHGLDFGDPGVSYRESLALFGLPLTEPQLETNSSGDTVLTQWFERARFEWHPGKPDQYKVLLGLLGNETLAGG